MRGRLRPTITCVALVVCTVALAACVPPGQPRTAARPAPLAAGWQQAMFDRVNGERAAAGLGSVAPCPRLDVAAQSHSVDQASHARMGHIGSDRSSPAQRVSATGYAWNAVGENVAYGFGDVTSVMNAWMGSAEHRANILDGAYVHLGLGQAAAANGQIYWTQVFGAGGTC